MNVHNIHSEKEEVFRFIYEVNDDDFDKYTDLYIKYGENNNFKKTADQRLDHTNALKMKSSENKDYFDVNISEENDKTRLTFTYIARED